MAKHVTIEIRVAYDEAHPQPTLEQLETAVRTVVGLGMLQDETGEAVVEDWSVTAMNHSESR